MTESQCSCPFVYVGSHRTDSRNWNPDCAEHGTASNWYRDVGRAKFAATNERLRELQATARKARRDATLKRRADRGEL